jgi:hypothetical protein
LLTAPATAVGLMVMVKVLGVPSQLTPPLVKVGVTVMVATTGAVPVFTALKAPMLPVPEASNPIAVLSLIQL